MPRPTSKTRRRFLKNVAAGAVALPSIVRSSALGKDGAIAPSERVALGFIGVGIMGSGHLNCFLQYPEVQVVAVCDPDQSRREYSKRATEETYARTRPGATCHAYNDLRELLARDDVDAVVIATGDNWHGAATAMAAKAGKDIYCEKPISKTVREARAMVAAVRRYGRVCQIGLQQRSTPEFVKACELVRGGAIGKVRHVYVGLPGTCRPVNLPPEPVPEGLDWNQWLGPAPWRPFNRRFHHYGRPPHVVPWHFCPDFGGGNLTSNTVHAFDVVQWGLGMDESGPVEIVPPETKKVPVLTYKYADGVVVQVTSKLDRQELFVPKGWVENTRIQNFGALFIGEEGWIHVGRRGYLKSFPEEILKNPAGEAVSAQSVRSHHQNWLDCIKTRQTPACDVSVGCRSTIVSHLGCIAHWTGRTLSWDPQREVFPADSVANRLCGRAMRTPWQI